MSNIFESTCTRTGPCQGQFASPDRCINECLRLLLGCCAVNVSFSDLYFHNFTACFESLKWWTNHKKMSLKFHATFYDWRGKTSMTANRWLSSNNDLRNIAFYEFFFRKIPVFCFCHSFKNDILLLSFYSKWYFAFDIILKMIFCFCPSIQNDIFVELPAIDLPWLPMYLRLAL